MKITNSDVIKSGENELIDAITADMDWGAIEEIFRKEHKLNIEEDVEYKKGDIVVHNNQVAYNLIFDIKVTLSVLLDREGNHISISSNSDLGTISDVNDLTGEVKDTPDTTLSGMEQHESPESSDMIPTIPDNENSQEKSSQHASKAGETEEQLQDKT